MTPVQRWIRERQWLVRLVMTLSLLLGVPVVLGVVSASPALATSALCSGFSACNTSPYTTHSWSSNDGTSYWGQDIGDSPGHNCTNYVAYYEQTLNSQSSTRPSWLGTGGAKVWYADANSGGIPEGSKPVKGAVAWWGEHGFNGDQGHVAVVEQVVSSTEIVVSWDTYPSGPYEWEDITTSDGNGGSSPGWPDGFIYLGVSASGNGGSGNSTIPGNWVGSGTTDYAVFRPSDGTWHYDCNGTGGSDCAEQQFGVSGDIPVPGYYFGSPQLDWAVYRPSDETWYIMNQATKYTLTIPFGLAGDIPVPGDYEGNGSTQPAIFRPSDDTWHVYEDGADVSTSFGSSGDIPVPAFWDGGSKEEPGVYRPSTGYWYYLTPTGTVSQQFGASGDIPVPGYYTGSSKPDFAVFRPSNSTWYIMKQSNNATTTVSFGLSGDIPVPGMYTGGTEQEAVFRPSNSTWYYDNGGAVSMGWGLSGDVPALSTLSYPLLVDYGLCGSGLNC